MNKHICMGLLLLWLLAACAPATPSAPTAIPSTATPTPAPLDEALLARGIEVYRANYCGSCHSLSVANTRGTFGPNHDTAGQHAAEIIASSSYQAQGSASTPADYIRESILNPTTFYTPGYEATNHHMPAFTHLPEADVDAMVYLLTNQASPAS